MLVGSYIASDLPSKVCLGYHEEKPWAEPRERRSMTTEQAHQWLREHAPCTVSFGDDAVHVRHGNGHPSATAATMEEAVAMCAEMVETYAAFERAWKNPPAVMTAEADRADRGFVLTNVKVYGHALTPEEVA
jgi:hypothetical protein